MVGDFHRCGLAGIASVPLLVTSKCCTVKMSGDRRFEAMHSAPIFKQSKKDSFKVKVDDRFKTLLTDERFQSVHGRVDKYGRKNKVKDNAKKVVEELKEFYDIDEGDEKSGAQASSAKPKAKQPQGGNMESRLDYLNRLARGEVSEESSSDSDGSDDESSGSSDDGGDSSEGSDESVAEEAQAGTSSSRKSALAIPEQPEPELVEDITSTRIAIQNCDWENVSAEDIMVVLQSFCPPGSGSSVRKVTVYVSDFGKKRMELESRYGPQGIWKEVQHEEEDDENADLYEGIEEINDSDEDGSEGEEGSEDGSEGAEGSQEEEDASDGSDSEPEQRGRQQQASKKSLKGADFVRRKGAVGLVLQSDIEGRGRGGRRHRSEADSDSEDSHSGSEDEDDHEDEASDSDEEGSDAEGSAGKPAKAAKKAKDGDGFDEVALRKYELSKLRYYFAVAECDSARTANRLYEELDGVEMEASSMVFDLSLVPEDLSFEDREVRDTYSASASGAVNPNYKPPDFVVNALQHTKVQCSWDEGEKLRDRHLSNFSTWRNLNESELQQYVASSASSDNDDDEEEEEEGQGAVARGKGGKKQNKAANMRKLLLGGEGESDSEEDDFFAKDGSDAGGNGEADDNSMYGSDGEVPAGFSEGEGDEEEDGEGKTLTYIPELGKDILAKKRGAAEETPYEAQLRKAAEKKKARKAAKKEFQEKQEAEKKAAVQAARKGGKGAKDAKGAKAAVITDDEARRQAELELLFEGEGDLLAEDDYDMRELVLAEKEKAKSGGKKNKRKKGNDGKALPGEDFQLDMADPRFSRLFEGDARFGIDKTSTEFRPTPATKEILAEQARRRAQKERSGGASRPAPETVAPQASARDDSGAKAVDVDNLVSKLKRKYAKV